MSATENTTQARTITRGSGRKNGPRGRGGSNNRGGNRNLRGNSKGGPVLSPVTQPEKEIETIEPESSTSEDIDAVVCWICAEPVKYYSISECNHRTCHVCALRLRALYKKTDCTFCKDPQPSVIFTVSPDALFSSFAPESIAYKDAKLAIYFETQEMMEETLILLRFNCPDPDCDYIGNGWGDLKLHVRATHGKLMCDLCIRSKKVFAHEHALYPPNVLPLHLPSMYRQHNKAAPKDQIEGGIHPLCEFCRECFFGDDELFAHMREKHEECFICKRNEVRDQYFQNYESLEAHFNKAHHPCNQPQCLARKFVVFNTTLDLKAHELDEHGGDMSARDRKDARRIQAEFEFEEVGVGGRHGRRDRGYRERDREPPQQRYHQQEQPPPPVPVAPPPRPPGPSKRREGFGSSLTAEAGASTPNNGNNSSTPQQSRPSSPPHSDVDPAVAERHAIFLARLQSLATNPTTAVPAVKAAIRGYRAAETSARDLISTIWTILDQNLEHTASIVNAFVDLLDQEEKKLDLLSSWKGFAIEQRRQFPDLVPTATGSGYAAIATGRVVLNAKHSTATRSSRRSSRQVWDRVAQAAGSSSSGQTPASRPQDRFPALHATSSGPSHTPMFRQGQRNTPWSSSSAAGFRPPASTPATNQSITVIPDPRSSRPGSGTNTPQPPPPKLSNSLFPELPTSNAGRPKASVSGNVSLRNILGNSAQPPTPAWIPGGAPSAATPSANGEAGSATSTGKGKKGKGKQKQTLFTLGSFPT